MKNITLFSILTVFLFSCSKKNENFESFESSSNTESDPAIIENLNIQTSAFTEIDSTGILMFPLQMGQNPTEDRDYSYKKMPDNGFWNIIFLNSNTNEYHLLTENKVLILDYNYNYNAEEGVSSSKKTDHIFYMMRSQDYNKDRLINDKDPAYLFVSDKSGKNLRQISPANYAVNTWKYIQASNKIVMTVTKDSNKNNEFDDMDEISTFEIILDHAESPKEVFGSELKDKLKKLYDRDWKKIK